MQITADMAQVTYHSNNYLSWCGGGILSEDLILTAAHCVKNSKTLENQNYTILRITVGSTKHFDTTKVQTFSVKDVHTHPDFKGHKGKMYHDVAVIRLDGNIKFNKKVQALELPSPDEVTPEGREIVISGWGRNPQNPEDKRLYQARMEISSYKDCAKRENEELEDFRKHEICGMGIEGHTCHGDSGSPAIDRETNHVIGLNSHSKGRCREDRPIVFVKITDNLDFIDRIMNGKKSRDSSESDQYCDD